MNVNMFKLIAWAAIASIAGCALNPLTNVPGADLGNAPGSPPDTTRPISYGFDVQPIFDKNCVSCHRTDGIADTVFGVSMHLTSGQAYNDLINKQSSISPEWQLVVPGDPEASLLYRIVEPSPPVGSQMPLLQPPLLDEEIEIIRAWIEEGAQAN